MNNLELNAILSNDPDVIPYFCGVFSQDNAPDTVRENDAFIVNTSPSWIPIGHWTAVANSTFFCSYGMAPAIYDLPYNINFNKVSLQSKNSDVCGLYAAMFIKLSCRRYVLSDIVDVFTDNAYANDCIIMSAFFQ